MPKQRKQSKRRHQRTQKGGVVGTVLKEAAKIGYKLGKDPNYQRMGAAGAGAMAHHKSPTSTWTRKERAAFNKWRYARDKKEHKATCCIM